MLCEDAVPSTTASPTPVCTADFPAAAGSAKKKKKKKKKFSKLMAEATQSSSPSPEEAEAEHRKKIARHLGGGTFSKLDKV